MPIKFASVLGLALLLGAGAVSANEGGNAGWQRAADNEISNLPSLQRGARNFMSYCSGCHSLKFVRYSRLAEDLKDLRFAARHLPGEAGQQILRLHRCLDARGRCAGMVWQTATGPVTGGALPRQRLDLQFPHHLLCGSDSRQTGVNNLQLPGTAMPHVLASVQGVQNAVWTAVEHKGEDGKAAVTPEFKGFEPGVVGSLDKEQYDEFARDIVNFLQYASDPTQVERQGMGIWVVSFLLMFTGIAYMLKKEYWKDVR